MHNFFLKKLFLGAAIFSIAGSGLLAQTAGEGQASSAAPYRLDIAGMYSAALSNAVGGSDFWMQGGGVQMHGLIYRGLGAVADLSEWHQGNIQSSGVGLDLFAATFGPRYTWQVAHTRYSFYGQGLFGVAGGFHSDFPTYYGTVPTEKSFAVKLGGGLNIALNSRIALRAIEADWLRTEFPNATDRAQSSCELGSGIVFRF